MTELSLGRNFQVNVQGLKYKLEIVFPMMEAFSYTDRDNRNITFENAANLEDWHLSNDLGKGNPIYILGQYSNYFSLNDDDSQGYLKAIEAFHIAIVTRIEIIDVITCEVPTIKIIKLSRNQKN